MRPATPARRSVLRGFAAASLAPGAAAAAQTHPTADADLLGWRVRVGRPSAVRADTPLVLLLPGLGPPATPAALATALPPVERALSVYVPLPFSTGAPNGGREALARRQQADYAGALFAPLLRAAARDLPALAAAATDAYGLAPDRPLHLFGFSLGGAAALQAVIEGMSGVRSVVAVNAPLSVRAAVAAYERRLGTRYVPQDPSVFGAFDLVAAAPRLRGRADGPSFHFAQSEADDQFHPAEARRAAAALNAGRRRLATVSILSGGHNALADVPEAQAAVRLIVTAAVHNR